MEDCNFVWGLGRDFPKDSSYFEERVESYWLERPTEAIGDQARSVNCHWDKDFQVRVAAPACY